MGGEVSDGVERRDDGGVHWLYILRRCGECSCFMSRARLPHREEIHTADALWKVGWPPHLVYFSFGMSMRTFSMRAMTSDARFTLTSRKSRNREERRDDGTEVNDRVRERLHC